MTRIFTLYFILIGISSLFHHQEATAQNKSVSYGARGRFGYLIKHRREIDKALEYRFPRGMEVFVHVQTEGDKPWQHEWNYPEIGVSLGWLNLDNPEVLGQVFLGTVYIQKYLKERGRKQNFSFKIAPGISYSTHSYNPETNPINILNSLPVNLVMEGNFLYHRRFAENWEWQAGISFTHYSNGAIRKPNKGVNVPALTVGMAYTPHPEKFQVNREVSFDYRKGNSFEVLFSGGLKSAGESYPKVDYAWNVSLFGNRRIASKSGLTFGAEIIYNESIPKILQKDDANLYRVGATLGHELYVSKLSFLTQIGYYVYRPEKKLDAPIYLRWGVKYFATSSLFATMLLKTHYGKADLVEFGLGYRFSRSKVN